MRKLIERIRNGRLHTFRGIDHLLYPNVDERGCLNRFWCVVSRHACPGSVVLDLGAGSGEKNKHDLKGMAGKVVGLDLDERVLGNALLDEGIVGSICEMPFDDDTFDLVFSVYVFEHLDDPHAALLEIRRVLKPEGTVVFLTPNRWHYVALIAKTTPHWFHRWFNRKRGRQDEDTFPTYYRLNSKKDVMRELEHAGFDNIEIEMIEIRPNYLSFSIATFLAGVIYERIVNKFYALSGIRVNIISSGRKPSVS